MQNKNGVILWNCHGCGESGDALTLVAKAHGLTMRGDDFRQVLIVAAEMGGLHGLVRELEGGEAPAERPGQVARPAVTPGPVRDYPPIGEVVAMLGQTTDVADDPEVAAWLVGRGLSPDAVDGIEGVRAIPKTATLPRFATYRGRAWTETGHRLTFVMRDADGAIRSLRAGRVTGGDSPKRLPPAGHRASGLVMACSLALAMLRGTYVPDRVLILEGEPDFLTWGTRTRMAPRARLGIMSGSWTQELAAKIPKDAVVTILTDNDRAGDAYATEIISTLGQHTIRRGKREE